jgi:hypothetical protein
LSSLRRRPNLFHEPRVPRDFLAENWARFLAGSENNKAGDGYWGEKAILLADRLLAYAVPGILH